MGGDIFTGMVGKSPVMKHLFTMIQKVASSEVPIFIQGETGTGKELVAKALHEHSRRASGPFVAVNCGAISPQLIESELFGHEKGSFTGAFVRHEGCFEQARGGTLFLDEIGEMPLEMQPKLLRVLENHSFRRVGAMQELSTDVRIVVATHRHLDQWVRLGKFREDLYFRLFSVPIDVPALRERREDIPFLATHFLNLMQGEKRKRFSADSLAHLKNHVWKGNVRELKNVITRSLLLSDSDILEPADILFFGEEGFEKPPTLAQMEREVIVRILSENRGNRSKTAETLGIAKSTLFQKLKDYRIEEFYSEASEIL